MVGTLQHSLNIISILWPTYIAVKIILALKHYWENCADTLECSPILRLVYPTLNTIWDSLQGLFYGALGQHAVRVCVCVFVCITIARTTVGGAVKRWATAGNTTTAELINNCGQEDLLPCGDQVFLNISMLTYCRHDNTHLLMLAYCLLYYCQNFIHVFMVLHN